MAIPSPVKGVKCFNQLTQDRQFKIIWDANPIGETITKYTIYRSENGSNGFVRITDTLVPNLQFIDTTIPFSFDKTWYYKVTATNTEGQGPVDVAQAITDFDYFAFQKPPTVMDTDAHLIRWVYNETPIGLINSVNTIYYTRSNYRPKTISIFVAGAKVIPANFVELTPNSIQLSTAPTGGATPQTLSVDYIRF